MNTGEVTIALFCGGGCQVVSTNLDIIGAGIGLFFDVPMELRDGVKLDSRVIPVPLAEKESVGSLLAKYKRDERFVRACQILEDRPGDLTQGLAQTPILGAMAYDQLHLEKVWDEVLNRVRAITNGAPEHIRVIVLGSNSGGTGRGTLLKTSRALVEKLHEATDAVVNVQHVRIGAQTFNGLGRHIRSNNAFVVEDLAHVLSHDHLEREVRHFLGLELPMVVENKAARDTYVRLVLQALLAPQTQETVGRRDVNMALTGAFGRLNTVQAGFWMLSDQVNLSASAAVALIPGVQGLLNELVTNLPMPRVEVSVRLTRQDPKYDELVKLALRKADLPTDYWGQMVETKFQPYTAVIVSAPGQEEAVPIANLLVTNLPKTLDGYRLRRSYLASLKKAMEQALNEAKQAESRLDMQYQTACQQVEKVIRLLFPPNIFWKIVSYLMGRPKNVIKLKAALQVLGRIEEQRANSRVRREALDSALESVDQAIKEHQEYVEQVHTWLLKTAKSEGVIPDLFTFCPIEEAFSGLMLGRFSNDEGRFQMSLVDTIDGVTREGLGMILGVADPTALNLARKMSEEAPIITPAWGGKRRRGNCRSLIVVPPTNEELFMQLQQALQDLEATAQLVQTDTVAGGVAVVQLHVYFVEDISDIWTTQYRADLVEAEQGGLDVLARIPGNAGKKELLAILKRVANGGGK